MKNTETISVGIFIDGGYLHNIMAYLQESKKKDLRIKGFIDFIRKKVQQLSGADADDCQITDVHYFRGRLKARDASDRKLLLEERLFEDELIQCDVIFHYRHIRQMQNDDNKKIEIEKGIDVWFALEAYELSQVRHFDYVVLITGDADHEMLIKKIKATKSKVLLVTWKTPNSSASNILIDETNYHVEMENELEQNEEGLKYLFK